jgi:glycosyltransferase involved in cell wall biosynthesis
METMDSILSQTFSDFEVIAVDDNSTDDSLSILEKYRINDPRIKLYKNKSRLGLVGNWNECIKKSSGQWIKFVFQDDILISICLEIMLLHAENNRSCKFICAKREFIYEEDVALEVRLLYQKRKFIWDIFPNDVYITPECFMWIVSKNLSENMIGEPTSMLFHRDIFDKYGYFNVDLNHFCDLEYFVRVGVHIGMVIVHETAVYFRVHNKSTSSDNVRHKLYQAFYIDKVILYHNYLHDELYKPLQNYVRHTYLPNVLEIYLGRAAAKSRLFATSNNDQEHLDIWLDTIDRYPIIEKFSRYSFFKTVMQYVLWKISMNIVNRHC